MKILLSLPSNAADYYNTDSKSRIQKKFFFCSDPDGRKVGSGGGTSWILKQWHDAEPSDSPLQKKIIIHAAGQSRRLPAYAPQGKVMTPIPVMRWGMGEKINQTLLSMQLPLYEDILTNSPKGMNTLIASGDVFLSADKISNIPDADVVCFGVWADAALSSHHGVFFSRRQSPEAMDFMLQKPTIDQINRLSATHFSMMDTGLWILSDRAVDLLRKMSSENNGEICFYDLYSQFGCALGENPSKPDERLSELKAVAIPLPNGEFHHFGTTRELLSSTLALQNRIVDQRKILHRKSKPAPSLFVQNCIMKRPLTSENENIWIENSWIGTNWNLTKKNVVTGVPLNDWPITLTPGKCLDIVPIGEHGFAVRPYGFDDLMRGATADESTTFTGMPVSEWARERSIEIPPCSDIQKAPLFPVVENIEDAGTVARWMISEPALSSGRQIWEKARKLSADEISNEANLDRLFSQRAGYLKENIPMLADNYANSVFYQLDLDNLSAISTESGLGLPDVLSDNAPVQQRMRNHMLRSRLASLYGMAELAETEEGLAYGTMRGGIIAEGASPVQQPVCQVHSNQIVWARSPVRIDLAGGWTDTPPYSTTFGGNVVNLAIELNGLPPLQVFIKQCAEHKIILRSIDLGASEVIETFEALSDYKKIGSPFSIPKAALSLAGFSPGFSSAKFSSLRQQLEAFGSGIEITLLSAVPAGSGLGTSSILSATLLGALSDFCGLAWDTTQISSRVLALEQLLTTCGGWQDQYGGVLPGVKLLQTDSGWAQNPVVNWLPEGLFNDALYSQCHLLYFTGVTRTAKGILGEIVRKMFLNSGPTLRLLDEMKDHALEMSQAIQMRDFKRYGALVGKSWNQNQRLDAGSNPAAVQAIINLVDDYMLGCKLPGAGGGGFLYMVAKDPDAARRIRAILNENPVNPSARFVEMAVSGTGIQISRS